MVKKQGSAIEPRKREEDITPIVTREGYLGQIFAKSCADSSHLYSG